MILSVSVEITIKAQIVTLYYERERRRKSTNCNFIDYTAAIVAIFTYEVSRSASCCERRFISFVDADKGVEAQDTCKLLYGMDLNMESCCQF